MPWVAQTEKDIANQVLKKRAFGGGKFRAECEAVQGMSLDLFSCALPWQYGAPIMYEWGNGKWREWL